MVINTCSVRERAEEKLFARLDTLRGRDRAVRPIVAVTGCVAQQEGARILDRAPGRRRHRRYPGADDDSQLLVEAATHTAESQVDINPYEDVSFPLGITARNDPVKAYVTIIEGCNDFCAFCVVPYTRGHERMRAAREIVSRRSNRLSAAGHREIHLLGQIVNHYAAPDIPGCDFAALLERVHEVPGVARIRFASPHPRYVSPRMIAAMRALPESRQAPASPDTVGVDPRAHRPCVGDTAARIT